MTKRGRRVFGIVVMVVALTSGVWGQTAVAGRNINMVSGTAMPDGDPYLQRQNEPSLAVSSRNSLHLLGGANDYRLVDIPAPPDMDAETGDAWVGYYRSIDGGQTWKSTLLPGYPFDNSPQGAASPLKAYGVATDPTVRPGTHGLFYYSGLAFNRGTNQPSAVFISTFQDQNNKGNGNPFAYLGTKIIDTGNTGQFIDKPWLAVDMPRPGTTVGAASCNLGGGAQATSGNAYLVWSKFLGTAPSSNPHSQITFSSSTDCGATWSSPTKLSEGFVLNQGTVASIDPGNGYLYIAWRQIANNNQPDQILYVMSKDGGKTFTKASVVYTFPVNPLGTTPSTAFDQSASASGFRTITLPALTVDQNGRVFVAFAERNRGSDGLSSRIMITTMARNGGNWTAPYVADPTATGSGHQFLPALTSGYGKIVLTWLDLRDDNTVGQLQCLKAKCLSSDELTEVRVPVGDRTSNPSKVFSTTVSDAGLQIRHTMDVRGAMVDPTAFKANQNPPLAFPSFRVSQYKFGSRPGQQLIEQMQYNPPNFPMFAKGKLAFIGDYIDVAAQQFTVTNGTWKFNTDVSSAPVFHAVWTDNRDVRPPKVCPTNDPSSCVQDWSAYTAPYSNSSKISGYDPTQNQPACVVTQTGSRNQNVYTSRLTMELVVAARENVKHNLDLNNNPVVREFAIYVQNNKRAVSYYWLTINNPSPATTDIASFLPNIPTPGLLVGIAANSTAARSVYVRSTQPLPNVTVSVQAATATTTSAPNGPVLAVLQLNADPSNPKVTAPEASSPDISNPDISSPDISTADISSVEIYSPTVSNPDISSPDISSPDISSPDISNPDISNPDISSPDISSPDISNPDISSPDITSLVVSNPDIANPTVSSPDISSPDISNPDIASPADGTTYTATTDVTWKLTNKGNTSASYNAKLLSSQQVCCPQGVAPGTNGCYKCALILRRTYPTPVATQDCKLAVEVTNIPISSFIDPKFVPITSISQPDTSSTPNNGTLTLGPGEGGRMTLRIFGLNTPGPGETIPGLGAAASAFSPNTGDAVIAASLVVTTQSLPPAFVGIPYSATLTWFGGNGPTRTWSLLKGNLPAGLTLNAETGTITGTILAVPISGFTVAVTDSPTAPVKQQIAHADLSIAVQDFSVQGVTSTINFVQPGGTVPATVTVYNSGPLPATNASATLSLGGTSCGTGTPISTTIGSTTQGFAFNCTAPASTDGTATFVASATGTIGGVTISTPTFTPTDTPPIVIDSVLPTIVGAAAVGGTPFTPSTTAWTMGPVDVTFSCTDNIGGSGVAAGYPTGATSLSNEGANQSVLGTCKDNAGNTTTAAVSGINIDTTAPQVKASAKKADGTAYTAGTFTNQNVTVTFACTDNLSGVASFTAPITVAATTASVTGSCKDNAGNSSADTAFGPINIDSGGPTVTFGTPTPAPTAAGWNNTDVSIPFTASDTGGSGVKSTTPLSPLTLTGQGTGITGSVTVTDNAGNTATFTSPAVKIDRGSPTVTISSPANGSTFALGATIPLTYSCTDGLSGIATCNGPGASGSTITASTAGTKTVTVVGTDNAGNVTTVTNTYTVKSGLQFTGFFSPLGVAGTTAFPTYSGQFNLGKAIPVKYQLRDASGNLIVNQLNTLSTMWAAYNPSGSCAGPGSITDPRSYLLYSPTSGATGGSTFRYDTNNNQYIFNWDTSVVRAGCYELIVTLSDGSSYATDVRLR